MRELISPDAQTIIGFLSEENPRSKRSEIEVAGRAAAVLTHLALQLPNEERRRLAEDDQFQERILDALKGALQLGPPPAPPARLVGTGLGRQLSKAQAEDRLQAAAEPQRIESWAGPVAGATELHRSFGIARSTLQLWRRQQAVVGLRKGVKKEVFPLAQFVDARPVNGIPTIMQIIPSSRVAWLWLTTPHPELSDRAPIDRLKLEKTDEVIELARADYGQP